jgi:hypothetical protein
MREPNVDPPPTDPPVEAPSDKPVQPPPTPNAREAASRGSRKGESRRLRLVRSGRRPRRAPTCVVGEITVSWRGIQVLQSTDCEKTWRTRR